MKSLKYILHSSLMLLAVSCMQEVLPEPESGSEEVAGDKVTITFGVDFASREYDGWGEGELATKAFGEMTNAKRNGLKLRIYVFDHYGMFTEYADAEIVDPQPTTIAPNDSPVTANEETVFSVELSRSKNARRLHFVAVDNNTYSVTQKYSYGSEATFMKGLSVSGGVDAYWSRLLLPDGIDDDTHFRRVPLLRNFAKIVLDCSATNFTPNGFTIVNVPSSGCVAPYNTASGGFAVFYTSTESNGVLTTTMSSYKNLLEDQQYKGYRPLDATWTNTLPTSGTTWNPTFNSVTKSGDVYTSTPYYLYESPNANGDDKGKTFMIVKGRYTGKNSDTYYKIDITYKETQGYGYTEQEIQNGAGVATFYNIYRNFNYVVKIEGVTFEGYSTAYEAAVKPAANNISASVLAEGVNNVSDGNQKRRLFVNKIYALYNEGGAKLNLKTKAYTYLGDLQNGNIKVLKLEDDGIFDVEPYIDHTVSVDVDEYSPIKFTLKTPTSTPKTAVLRVYISETPTYETLFRDITIVSRQYYPLLVDCTDVVNATTGTSFNAQLLVPNGISKNLFPLQFKMEPEEKTIYPDATKNQLPVDVGKSILPGHSDDNSFQYVRTITYAEYTAAPSKSVGGTNYKVLDAWFKTNTAVSETTIYAFNEYFNKASGKFENGVPVFQDGDLAVARVIPSDYYGAGNSYHYVEFKTVRATGNVNISLTEGTAAPVTWNNYNLATTTHRSGPVDGVYTYKVPFLTQTFKSTDYYAEVSYVHDATFTQTISGTASQERRYLFLPVGSFAPTNLTSDFADEERFKSGIIYDPTHFDTVDPANCGKIAFNASGTTEIYNRDGAVDTDYEGYKFADNTGYHIGTYRHAFYDSLDENWKLRFYHSTGGKHNAPDDGSHTWRDDWYAEVTVGAITVAHARDFQAGYLTENASAPNNGLFKLPLTWVDPANP